MYITKTCNVHYIKLVIPYKNFQQVQLKSAVARRLNGMTDNKLLNGEVKVNGFGEPSVLADACMAANRSPASANIEVYF